MIDSVTNINAGLKPSVANISTSPMHRIIIPPLLEFKKPPKNLKANLRVKKIKRSDNIAVIGDIDDDYVDIIQEEGSDKMYATNPFSTTSETPSKTKIAYLKNCYVVDYIQSPQMRKGLGTIAIKQLAEKAMFDSRAEGRIVTFSSPVWQESSPAIFFYKLGFRFLDADANEYIQKCINDKIPDIPPQTGMMYLPRIYLHKLLRYGDGA